MTRPPIPSGLLEKCLETIPANAQKRSGAPRLITGDGSRNRLLWLSVAAAVPVVTVLGVLPVRQWINLQKTALSTEQTKSGSETNKSVVPFCSATGAVRQADLDARDAEHWYTGKARFTESVWLIGGGYYERECDLIEDSSHFLTGALAERVLSLYLSNGTTYRRVNDIMSETKESPATYEKRINDCEETMFDSKRAVALITGYGISYVGSDGKKEELPIVLEHTSYDKMKRIYIQRPPREWAERGAPTIRVQFYRISPSGSDLCSAVEAYAFWESGRLKERPPIRVYYRTYNYRNDNRFESIARARLRRN